MTQFLARGIGSVKMDWNDSHPFIKMWKMKHIVYQVTTLQVKCPAILLTIVAQEKTFKRCINNTLLV